MREVAIVVERRELGIDHRDGGTMVVIEGPRFSTRAESKMFAQLGGDVIGMTQFPEVCSPARSSSASRTSRS